MHPAHTSSNFIKLTLLVKKFGDACSSPCNILRIHVISTFWIPHIYISYYSLFSNSLYLCSNLRVQDEPLLPYETTCWSVKCTGNWSCMSYAGLCVCLVGLCLARKTHEIQIDTEVQLINVKVKIQTQEPLKHTLRVCVLLILSSWCVLGLY